MFKLDILRYTLLNHNEGNYEGFCINTNCCRHYFELLYLGSSRVLSCSHSEDWNYFGNSFFLDMAYVYHCVYHISDVQMIQV